MNSIVLMGRLTADPELKTTPNGVFVTSFSLAVQRRSQRGECDFIPIVAWRGNAEAVTKYFEKGQMMALIGRVSTRSYEDREGKTRKVFEVTAEEVYFCSSKERKEREKDGTEDEELPFALCECPDFECGGQLPF